MADVNILTGGVASYGEHCKVSNPNSNADSAVNGILGTSYDNYCSWYVAVDGEEWWRYDLTPPASSNLFTGGSATAGASNYGGSATNAFDEDTATIWGYSGAPTGTCWLQYDLGDGNDFAMTSYSLSYYGYGALDNYKYTPKEWTIQGSNNDSDWDTLDTITAENGGATLWIKGAGGKKYFRFANTTSYRYYKIVITAANSTALGINVFEGFEEEQTPVAKRIYKYGIYGIKYSGWDQWGYFFGPDWTLYGSNDNSSWTSLDVQTNQTWSVNGQWKYYVLSATSAKYEYYKIVLDDADRTTEILCEIELYEGAAADANAFQAIMF